MSDYKVIMHQIWFPRPRCVSLQHSPDPQLYLSGPNSKGKEEKGKWRGRTERERGGGRKEGRTTPVLSQIPGYATKLESCQPVSWGLVSSCRCAPVHREDLHSELVDRPATSHVTDSVTIISNYSLTSSDQRSQTSAEKVLPPGEPLHTTVSDSITITPNLRTTLNAKQDRQTVLKAKHSPQAMPLQHFKNPGQLDVTAASATKRIRL